jgi:ribosomal protein L13
MLFFLYAHIFSKQKGKKMKTSLQKVKVERKWYIVDTKALLGGLATKVPPISGQKQACVPPNDTGIS